jgi:peptide deformylase
MTDRSIKDWLLQVTEGDPILRKTSFDVPIRLFKSNKAFKTLIKEIVLHMYDVLSAEYKDYKNTKGISGANVGIPYNIIVVKDGDGYLTMLNPAMTPVGDETKVVSSNCGSIVLREKVKVRRHEKIAVSWYDLSGEFHIDEFEGKLAYTLQHEIDHTLGILIIDKEEE